MRMLLNNFKRKLGKLLPILLGLAGAGLIVFWLIPTQLSLLEAVHFLFAPITVDGDVKLTALDLERLQGLALWAGLFLVAAGLGGRFAWRSDQPRWRRIFSWGIALLFVLGIVLAGNILLTRSNSWLFQVVDDPEETEQEGSRVEEQITPVPTPTLALSGTGRWVLFVEGLELPVALEADPGREGRFYVLQKGGLVSLIQDGVLVEPPFLDLRDRVLPELASYEQGLLGFALHPEYEENGYFFVSYVNDQSNLVISRFERRDASAGDPDSEKKLLGVFQPGPTHQGGTLRFGPDGYLYIGLGDGTHRKNTVGHAQSLDNLYGKIIRIDVDNGEPYAIPPDNPFAASYGMDEVYAYGLRNPWQLAFDAANGDMYIADVGQNTFEEINFIPGGHPGGLNFGWSIKEGRQIFNPDLGTAMPGLDLVGSIFEYDHEYGNCSVTGGQVYYGEAFPEMQGAYIFGDFCSGIVWSLRKGADGTWQHQLMFDTIMRMTSFAAGHNNELYATDLGGNIWAWVP